VQKAYLEESGGTDFADGGKGGGKEGEMVE
jgi:hypothetical protein